MEIFQHDFMRRAFIVGLALAVSAPCVGVIVSLKRLSMIGDALSHVSLAGVAIGLLLGFNPVAGAATACVFAALGIEFIRNKIPKYSEMSIAVVSSAGIGLAGVLSGFVKSANFNSFLFGSISAIKNTEMTSVIVVSICVLIVFVLLYDRLFFVALDEKSARLAGVQVKAINFVFTVLTAAVVSTAARTVGALMVSSLMITPVACSMQVAKSYRQTILFSVVFAVFFMVAGLFAAYYLSTKPGASVSLIGVICLLAVIIAKRAVK
jgi:zinc transport system permease protein